jgi:hypothetical protein
LFVCLFFLDFATMHLPFIFLTDDFDTNRRVLSVA